jgi:hypothetical protein
MTGRQRQNKGVRQRLLFEKLPGRIGDRARSLDWRSGAIGAVLFP